MDLQEDGPHVFDSEDVGLVLTLLGGYSELKDAVSLRTVNLYSSKNIALPNHFETTFSVLQSLQAFPTKPQHDFFWKPPPLRQRTLLHAAGVTIQQALNCFEINPDLCLFLTRAPPPGEEDRGKFLPLQTFAYELQRNTDEAAAQSSNLLIQPLQDDQSLLIFYIGWRPTPYLYSFPREHQLHSQSFHELDGELIEASQSEQERHWQIWKGR